MIISFFGTYYVMPHSIRKLKESDYLAKDMYKLNTPLIPTNAGLIIMFTSIIAISINPLIIRIINISHESYDFNGDYSQTNLALLLVVLIYGIYGFVDDLVDIGRKLKVVFPIAFSFPLASVIYVDSINLGFLGNLNLSEEIINDVSFSDIFRITIVPIYVMVVANLVNMNSGYNGLQSGLSIIILSTISIKSFFDGKLEYILPVASFLGAFLAFWFFNIFPAKIFEGNIGSLLFGSVIGSSIVIQNYWWFGFFILIPHTFNFILWILWLVLMRVDPKSYLEENGLHRKFGTLSLEGTIIVPNRLTLKWIPNYYFKMTEFHSTLVLYILTSFFCISGLILFK